MQQADETIFVGREQELSDLLAAAEAAFAGNAGVVFITGEAGIGKTSLVEEFFRRQAQAYLRQALAEFRRLDLPHKAQEAQEVLEQFPDNADPQGGRA